MNLFKKLSNVLFMLFGFAADIVTVTTGTAGVAGNVAADLQTYFNAKLLEVAELHMVLDQFGEKTPIPSNSSKTIQFTRMEKLAVSASPSQLIEGVAPDATGLVLNQFQAVAEQYGVVLRISDLAELTAKHPIVQRAIYILGLNAAELYDQLIFNVLSASTNVYRPNGKAGDVNLTQSDQFGYSDLAALGALLMDQGARMFSGDYVLVVPPQVYGAILKDPDFKAANAFGKPDRIWRGEVGELAGFRIIRSNAPGFSPITQATAGAANKVYVSFAIAEFAYQVADLQNIRTYVVAPGGQTDPLQQSRKLGYKFAFKAIITNNNWLWAVHTAGLNSVNN